MSTGTSLVQKLRSSGVVFAGKALSRFGHLAVPLGAGLLLGYYLADQGVPFLPTTLEVALLFFVLGFICLPLGRWLQGTAFVDTSEKRGVRKRVVVLGVLASVAVLLRLLVFWMESPAPLTELSHGDYNRAYDIDVARFRALNAELNSTLRFLSDHTDLTEAQDPTVLTAHQEQQLLDAWSSIYNSAFVVDQIRMFHEDWYRFDPSRAGRRFHLRSFLLSFASELLLYEKGSRLAAMVQRNPHAKKFLDVPHPSHGLVESSFSRFREELIGGRDMARVVAGQQYLRFLEKGLNGRNEAEDLGVSWLWDDVERRLSSIEEMGLLSQALKSVRADAQPIKRRLRRSWLFTQTGVARMMGNTRLRRIGDYLITREQQERADKKLEPGDVLLARKNWYLSNVGLPGFWPHAMLYLGDPKKLGRYFDTPEVRALIGEISGRPQPITVYLAETWPKAWATYTLGDKQDSHRLIEAISEGVVFNTLAHSAGDYLAAIRPKLDKVAKAQAVIAAFGHFGKPYDFDFDFATDHALVCTELVWRSLRPGPQKQGVDFPLVEIMGRKTLPANDIAKAYAKDRSSQTPSFEFVLFVDAFEKSQKTFEADEDAFVKSHKRTKWDIALE